MRLLAVDHHLTGGRRHEVADDRRSVDFPQPDGPISETNSLGLTSRSISCSARTPPRAKSLVTDLSDTTAAWSFTRCSGARRTTSFSARTMKRKNAMPRSAAMMFVAHRLSGELA